MKRLIYLLLFIPFLSFGQEVKVAEYSSSWIFVDSVIIKSNIVSDSMGLGINWYSLVYQNDTTVSVYGTDVNNDTITDVLFVKVVGTVMSTDFLSAGCQTICTSGGCTGCYKKADCTGCGCNGGNGTCLDGNYGVEFDGNMSNVIREYLILSIGNEVPKY